MLLDALTYQMKRRENRIVVSQYRTNEEKKRNEKEEKFETQTIER